MASTAPPLQPIEFDRETIGHILGDKILFVPKNQRPYSWEDEHVSDLYSDLRDAKDSKGYFLGSIVVIMGNGRIEVNDGQQRLATSLILIAAIRDYFFGLGDTERATEIQTKYLVIRDIRTRETIARMHLSGSDHEFFLTRILLSPNDQKRLAAEKAASPTKPSNIRLLKAATIAKKEMQTVTGAGRGAPIEEQTTALLDLIQFLEESARVMWVEVGDARTAFLIFETMNDRGLKLSSADLLKNYIFGVAGTREDEAFEKWQRMVGKLEILAEGEAAVVDYIRYLWLATHGAVRSRELYDKIKGKINNQSAAMSFVTELEARASDYAALSTPTDERWNAYGETARRHVHILDILGVKQVRILLMAALPVLNKKQMTLLLNAAVSWSVRFLVCGIPSGNLEGYYVKAATAIRDKSCASFSNIAVSQPPFVVYYLRSLQICRDKKEKVKSPEYEPSQTSHINREHIMPESLDRPEWAHIPRDVAKQFLNRLGNQVLLEEVENSAVGNESYAIKKPTLEKSHYSFTRDAAAYPKWDLDTIRSQQAMLAEWAVKTWPLRHQ